MRPAKAKSTGSAPNTTKAPGPPQGGAGARVSADGVRRRHSPQSVVFATSSLDNLNRLGRTSKLAGTRLNQLYVPGVMSSVENASKST
ncbi:hypothetical protein GCM10025863_19880 [Microbacterium suwonense]|uniref:Uncharacterized protein n=1 Tax=Microbacterium suwonense TaxID=683047 RepID=A0ABN6X3T7_9MICO|nr:hypothetical protein GCM10025863_19880 [Microbacterium suwonense]